MEIIMVRHARPMSEHRTDGPANPGLSELGIWQADRLCRWLDAERIDHLVCSPKRRARETTSALEVSFGLEATTIDDFDEIDRGASVYLPTELLMTEGGDYWEAIQNQRWDEIGWDTPDTFRARVSAAFDELCGLDLGDRIVLSCHGGVIRFVLTSLLGSHDSHISIDYASITRIGVDPDSGMRQVLSINETGHFDAERTRAVGPMRRSG